jgi:hypothetical protein
MKLRSAGSLRILHFDLENRPLSYRGQDWTTAEITAVAWSWADSDQIDVLLLQRNGRYEDAAGKRHAPAKALQMFADVLRSAGIVTGHYIRKHDLTLYNGALLDHQLPPLRRLLVSDTQADLVKRKDFAASQGDLAELYELEESKFGMSQPAWRSANRLETKGIARTRKRVVDDVIQHKAVRRALVERGALKEPRGWNS